MNRFVILRHVGSAAYKPGTHWDLMLEADGRLRTWELADDPGSLAEGMRRVISAIQLPDHRLAYLDYEGPITGDRGAVTRGDAGEYRLVSETPLKIVCEFFGGCIKGLARLTRKSTDSPDWQLDIGGQSET